jgi:hypothetical protein
MSEMMGEKVTLSDPKRHRLTFGGSKPSKMSGNMAVLSP